MMIGSQLFLIQQDLKRQLVVVVSVTLYQFIDIDDPTKICKYTV